MKKTGATSMYVGCSKPPTRFFLDGESLIIDSVRATHKKRVVLKKDGFLRKFLGSYDACLNPYSLSYEAYDTHTRKQKIKTIHAYQ